MMNCDQAFDALTDPLLCHGDELRSHLETCPRCRDMRDTLQPALALFERPPEQSVEYFAGMDVKAIDEVYAQTVPLPHVVPLVSEPPVSPVAAADRPRRRRVFSYAAMFLAGVMVASGVVVLQRSVDAPQHGIGPAVADDCLWLQRDEKREAIRLLPAQTVAHSCTVCHLAHEIDDGVKLPRRLFEGDGSSDEAPGETTGMYDHLRERQVSGVQFTFPRLSSHQLGLLLCGLGGTGGLPTSVFSNAV